MAAQLLNEGLDEVAQLLLQSGITTTVAVKLFVNSVSSSDPTLTFTDFDTASDTGASTFVELPYSDWTLGTPSAAVIDCEAGNATWIFAGTPTESYFGYLVYDETNSVGLWYELFVLPVPNVGGPGALILQLNLSIGAV